MAGQKNELMETMRIGFGYDVHRLVPGRRLMLGGVRIPSPRGLEGHSDADVLLHAVCDALLGAAALGDIGKHFPPSSRRFKNIASVKLLDAVYHLLKQRGYAVVNVDTTVVLDHPKIMPQAMAMRRRIARALRIPVTRVSVKATTNEGLGFLGRGEGCAAFAVAGIQRTAGK
jgi:2-C-methyl-D-erythritol 2,4-cyclodiphosphate synthase